MDTRRGTGRLPRSAKVWLGAGMDPELGRTFSRVEYFRALADYQGEPPPPENASVSRAKAEIFVDAIRARLAAGAPASA